MKLLSHLTPTQIEMLRAGAANMIGGRFLPVFAGGDGEGPLGGEVEAQLADLANLEDDALASLDETLTQRAREIRDTGNLGDDEMAELEAIRDAVASIRTESQTRETAAAEREATADELLQAIDPPAAEGDGETEGNDGTGNGGEGEEGDEGEAGSTTVETETTTTTEVEQPEAVAAAAPPVRRARPTPPSRQGTPTPAAAGPETFRSRPTIVAAGDVPGYSAGTEIPDVNGLGDAFARKVEAARGSAGKYSIASLRVAYPDDRYLLASATPEENRRRIQEVVDGLTQAAIVASGGLCAPVDVSYDLPTVGSTARPVRDSLIRFGADRGGLRVLGAPKLTDLDGAIGVWTELNDRAPGTDQDNPVGEQIATKPCLTISCGEELEVMVDAITQCLKTGNFNRRFFTEQFAAWWGLAAVAHARLAEDRMWGRIIAQSTEIVAGSDVAGLSATRDILATVEVLAAAYRSRHRIEDATPLRLLAPSWIQNVIRADLVLQSPGDNTYNTSEAQVTEFFRARNINVTWALDAEQEFGAQAGAGAAALRFPDTVEMALFHEGAFTFVDGGTMDFGLEIRDSTLNRTNDVEAQLETFENVIFTGVESLAVTMDLCVSGAGVASVTGECLVGS